MATITNFDSAPGAGFVSIAAGFPELGAPDFAILCTARALVPRRRSMKSALLWRCHLQGKRPERVWTNSESFVISVGSWLSACAVPPQVRVSDLCSDRLAAAIRALDRFPVSYNKVLLQGAADYCMRVLSRINEEDEHHRPLLNRVRQFASQVAALCSQYTDGSARSFPLLDLQIIEDKFELIQNESARLQILAHLRDIPTGELVER